MDDIFEVIDAYKTNTSINHFLIGGGSEAPDSDFCNINPNCKIHKKPLSQTYLPNVYTAKIE